jgi:N,N'-diacetyllegionaminate synthase
MKTFIIAEAGVNHNGKADIAHKLVEIAAAAGADAVKFQTFKAEKVVTRDSVKAKYQMENTGGRESQLGMLKRLELPLSGYKELFSICRRKGLIFMSTPFDEESADFLERLGMRIFKIPSGEITNKPLIRHIAAKKKTIILSTGMSYLNEVEKAIGWIYEVWGDSRRRPGLTLLHCVSNYPARVEDVNLKAIKTLESAFGLPVGYSDHAIGVDIAVAAVAMGASVIEKHFTLGKDIKGPDHKASLEPDELRRMVAAIRNVEKARGDGIKRPAKSEFDMRKIARRSLVAGRDIKAGEVIRRADITVKRPGTGLSPEKIADVINKIAASDISRDSLFKIKDLLSAKIRRDISKDDK